MDTIPPGSIEQPSELSFLSSEALQAILFDTFEMSEGSLTLQIHLFGLFEVLYPNIRIDPECDLNTEIRTFIQQNSPFLTSGKYHSQRPDFDIQITIEKTFELFSRVISKSEPPVHTGDSGPIMNICFSEILEREIFFVRTRKRQNSYLKKYYVDGNGFRNFYSQGLLDVMRPAFDARPPKLMELADAWMNINPGEDFWTPKTRVARKIIRLD